MSVFARFAAAVAVGVALVAAAASWDRAVGSVHALFWFTVVITLLCAVGAVAVMVLANRLDGAELGVLGAALFVISMLPFVHGLTIPGVLYDDNTTTMFSAWVALPAGLVVALPAWAGWRWVLRRWRAYTLLVVVLVQLACAYLLTRPDAAPLPNPSEWWTVVGSVLAVVGALVVSHRHLRLYAIGGRLASLVAAVGIAYIGLSSLLWLVEEPTAALVWVAHGLDGFGVLLAVGGLLVAHRRDGDVADALAPVVQRDPAVALRLGVTPQIEMLVGALGHKDGQSWGHVVRVAELATRVGERAGLSGSDLRTLGLGALLHDIGKIDVPDHILRKPGSLDPDEYALVKEHTIRGERLLAGDPMLVPVASLVRSHHERVDGRGYPDGLTGDEVSLEVSIISVCDAWDAMVHTRHYRAGLSETEARATLAAHAGTQWRRDAVELLERELDDGFELLGVFGTVGVDDLAGDHLCDEAVPPSVVVGDQHEA